MASILNTLLKVYSKVGLYTVETALLGKYGRSLHVWDWKEHTLLQDIDLGDDGMIPLELRFLHDPDATEGYVAAALSSNMIHFYKDNVGQIIIA